MKVLNRFVYAAVSDGKEKKKPTCSSMGEVIFLCNFCNLHSDRTRSEVGTNCSTRSKAGYIRAPHGPKDDF